MPDARSAQVLEKKDGDKIYAIMQGITQRFWEVDVLKELGKLLVII